MFIKVEDIDLHAALPRQLHLALTTDPREMTVMWATRTSNTLSMVEVWPFGSPDQRQIYRGSISTLDGSATIMHTCLLQGLQPGCKYSYRVGDSTIDCWSREYWFETRPRHAETNTRFAAVGDLDLREDGTRKNLEFLHKHIHDYDVLLLLGDLCYAKGSDVWDEFGEALEPISAIRPVMVLPGNHENEAKIGKGFHTFNTRFCMPDNGHFNQWYSFNLGNLHFVSLCTEDSLAPNSPQGSWLTHDLKTASGRGDYTILLAHKAPIGSADKVWCHKKAPVLFAELEPYLTEFNIQLALFGHIHLYERTMPINGVTYITAGVGGAKLDTEFQHPQPDWSAYRHAEHGACFFQHNHQTQELTMQYRSAYDARVVDSFQISTASLLC